MSVSTSEWITNPTPGSVDEPAATKVAEAPEAPVTADRPDAAVVRAWAKENDVEVGERGRIKQSVYDAYEADQIPAL